MASQRVSSLNYLEFNNNDPTSPVALIAGRIWWVPLRVTQIQGSNGNLGRTPIAIMESGAIYSISLIILMVLYVRHTYAQNIVLDSMIQIIVSSIYIRLLAALLIFSAGNSFLIGHSASGTRSCARRGHQTAEHANSTAQFLHAEYDGASHRHDTASRGFLEVR